MNQLIKRFLSILLSVSIIIISSISFSFVSNAEIKSYTWDELKEKSEMFIFWAYSQMGAIIKDHDFAKVLKNEEAFNSYFNEEHVTLSDDGTITIDKEFMEWLKNWLINYQKQNETYYLSWSTGFDELSLSNFRSYPNLYNTVKNVLNTAPSGAIKVAFSAKSGYTDLYISAYDNLSDVGFVRPAGDVSHNQYSISTFELLQPDVYGIRFYTNDSVIESWEEFKEKAVINITVSSPPSNYSLSARRSAWLCDETERYQSMASAYSLNRMVLITRSRITFRCFRSTDDFFDYALGKRNVYITNEFWEKEPEDFTATFEELNDSIDRMDDILQRLLDKINDKTDESTIEVLLQQILDEMRNGGGSGGNSSGGGSSGSTNLEGIYAYLQGILDYLDAILEGIESLVWFEWNGDKDNEMMDITDMFKKIKDNPETGSQEVADTLTTSFSDIAKGLTKKFPFSIPWDLYGLFTVFSETDTPKAAETNVLSVPYISGDGNVSIPVTQEDIVNGVHDAPYFKLPIKVESFGIYEEIVVDLKDFQTLSTLSRTLFSLIFAVFLIKLTIQIITIFRGGDSG